MVRTVRLCAAVVSLLVVAAPVQALDTWQLPLQMNDQNTSVSFEVDSTWHMVHGKTAGVEGKVWLEDAKDPATVSAEFSIPVATFDTDNSSRDERMREVLRQTEFPKVTVRLNNMDPQQRCTPTVVEENGECDALSYGTISINGVQRELRLPLHVTREAEHFKVDGKLPFEWAAFNIEDPSILVARLNKTVTVKYSIAIPAVERASAENEQTNIGTNQ